MDEANIDEGRSPRITSPQPLAPLGGSGHISPTSDLFGARRGRLNPLPGTPGSPTSLSPSRGLRMVTALRRERSITDIGASDTDSGMQRSFSGDESDRLRRRLRAADDVCRGILSDFPDVAPRLSKALAEYRALVEEACDGTSSNSLGSPSLGSRRPSHEVDQRVEQLEQEKLALTEMVDGLQRQVSSLATATRASQQLVQSIGNSLGVQAALAEDKSGSPRQAASLDELELEAAPPNGEVALVFLDVPGSQDLARALPDDTAKAITMQTKVVRMALRQFQGYEVGIDADFFVAAFSTPSIALRWCLHVQHRLMQAHWPPNILQHPAGKELRTSQGRLLFRGLRTRMGIHVGTPAKCPDTTGRVVFCGPVVMQAARVASLARAGEMVISQQAKALLERPRQQQPSVADMEEEDEEEEEEDEDEGDVLGQFKVRTLGAHKLVGFPQPTEIFSLVPLLLGDRVLPSTSEGATDLSLLSYVRCAPTGKDQRIPAHPQPKTSTIQYHMFSQYTKKLAVAVQNQPKPAPAPERPPQQQQQQQQRMLTPDMSPVIRSPRAFVEPVVLKPASFLTDLLTEVLTWRSDPKSHQQRVQEALTDRPKGASSLPSLGTGPEVPLVLRGDGTVSNRQLSTADLDTWVDKIFTYHITTDLTVGQSLRQHLLHEYSDSDLAVQEWAASIVDSCERFGPADWRWMLLRRCVCDEIPAEVYWHARWVIKGLQKSMLRAHPDFGTIPQASVKSLKTHGLRTSTANLKHLVSQWLPGMSEAATAAVSTVVDQVADESEQVWYNAVFEPRGMFVEALHRVIEAEYEVAVEQIHHHLLKSRSKNGDMTAQNIVLALQGLLPDCSTLSEWVVACLQRKRPTTRWQPKPASDGAVDDPEGDAFWNAATGSPKKQDLSSQIDLQEFMRAFRALVYVRK